MSPVGAIARRVANRGINVVYTSGWEGRSNGQSWQRDCPEGIVDHHTAGGNNVNIDQNLIYGVPGLSGPLCNFCIMYDGDLGVIANGPANHAGASGGWDTAPFPNTGMFNSRVLGVEVQYKGTEPMSAAQWNTLAILNHETLEEIGRGGQYNRIKNHQGTSIQGKWDMGIGNGVTYNIADVRSKAAAAGAPPEDWNPVWLQMMGVTD